MIIKLYITEVDLGFSEGGAKPSSESLKQGVLVGGHSVKFLKYQNL